MATGSTPSYFAKNAAALVPAQLQEYEPLAYEIEMLREIAALAVRLTSGPGLTPLMENLLTEAFALHFRNLAAFLWPGQWPRKRDVLGKHFASDPSSWVLPAKPLDLDDLVNRASREVAHLTTKRAAGKRSWKTWKLSLCIELLLTALEDFARRADGTKLPKRVPQEIRRLRNFMTPPKTLRILASINLTTTTTRLHPGSPPSTHGSRRSRGGNNVAKITRRTWTSAGPLCQYE